MPFASIVASEVVSDTLRVTVSPYDMVAVTRMSVATPSVSRRLSESGRTRTTVDSPSCVMEVW